MLEGLSAYLDTHPDPEPSPTDPPFRSGSGSSDNPLEVNSDTSSDAGHIPLLERITDAPTATTIAPSTEPNTQDEPSLIASTEPTALDNDSPLTSLEDESPTSPQPASSPESPAAQSELSSEPPPPPPHRPLRRQRPFSPSPRNTHCDDQRPKPNIMDRRTCHAVRNREPNIL